MLVNVGRIHSPRIIIDNEGLKKCCIEAYSSGFICIDTEFCHNADTYYPLLCLIQMSYATTEVVIDVLSKELDDFSPLERLMLDPGITKVFHSCKHDLLCIKRLIGETPHPIFDTQIAEMVCDNCNCYLSYSKLVKKDLGITVEKRERNINWSNRPLRPESIEYALWDVIHLKTIYPALLQRINKQKKGAVLEEEFEEIVKSIDKLPKFYRYQASIRPMMEWREKLAKAHNMNAEVILSEKTIKFLLKGSLDSQMTQEAIIKQAKKGKKFYTHSELKKQILKAKSTEKSEQTEECSKMADFLSIFLQLKCTELGMPQILVNSKTNIKEMIRNPEDQENPLNKGWREENFGRYIRDIIQGNTKISITLQSKNIWSYETKGS